MFEADSGRLRVVDPLLLGDILGSILETHRTHAAAAVALDISQPHFSRLLIRIGPRISVKLAKALDHEVAGSPRESDLWKAVIRPDTELRMAKFTRWVVKSIAPYIAISPRWGMPQSDYRRDAMFRLLSEIQARRKYKEMFDDFEARVQARGIYPLRISLARHRVVEPLLAAEETGDIERSWKELDRAGELGTYLRAAFRKEEILLRRRPEEQRAAAEESDV